MAHLPPTGWADVARTHDLEVLRTDIGAIRQEMVTIEERIGLPFEARLHAETNRLMLLLIPTIVSTLGLTFAAARLA